MVHNICNDTEQTQIISVWFVSGVSDVLLPHLNLSYEQTVIDLEQTNGSHGDQRLFEEN